MLAWSREYRGDIPSNNGPNGIRHTTDNSENRIVLRILLQTHIIRQDNHDSGHETCRTHALKRTAQQEHAPSLRRRTQGTPNKHKQGGQLQRNMTPKDIGELTKRRNERCRRQGKSRDNPIQLAQLVCSLARTNTPGGIHTEM